jgi:diamine N-acetyltransferase
MCTLIYEQGGGEFLERVRPLWEKLNEHHLSKTHYFQQHYSTFTFDQRREPLLVADLTLHVDLALDEDTKRDIAYCISTVNSQGVGEVESIYIDPGYRKLGIGDQLMKHAMQWMDGQPVKRRQIAVAEGNEAVFAFYEHYGFYPRKTILEYIPATDKNL